MHLVQQFEDKIILLYMRTRINEIHKQIAMNENEALVTASVLPDSDARKKHGLIINPLPQDRSELLH